jgi:hypothetical protein
MRRILRTVLVLGLLRAGGAAADTVWVSPITSAVTWTKAAGPHTWSGDLNLNSGAEVTVEPGAVVRMPSAGHLRVNAGARILALGSSEDPIRFGGVSETVPGATLWLDSPLTSEFRFCHFAYMERVRISSQSPQANHLFEHCIFRRFLGAPLELVNAPARVLHCIFRDNPTDRFGVEMTFSDLSAETCPTIWYNAFDCNGLAVWTAADLALSDYDFFRYNRVGGGTGVRLGMDKYGAYRRLRLLDCDLGGASSSVHCQGHGSGWDGTVDAMSIERCTLSSLTRASCAFPNVTNLANNYWGTTNMDTIATALFGGAITSSVALPISTTNVFPQADVDGSDGGNRTLQADAEMVKKAVVGLLSLTPSETAIADVDRNGVVDARDALLVESYINGLMWKLPVP